MLDAARATEAASQMMFTVEQLKERLKTQMEEAAAELMHVRQLKAQMAKRARDADARASASYL